MLFCGALFWEEEKLRIKWFAAFESDPYDGSLTWTRVKLHTCDDAERDA